MSEALTESEFEALLAIAEGEQAVETAERCGIAVSTVSGRRQRVMARLGARNGAHAVALAYHLGILVPRVQRPV